MDIKEQADNYIGHSKELDEGIEVTMRRQAFIDGAKWMLEEQQKSLKSMLYKAVKWVEWNASDYAWFDFDEYYLGFEVNDFIRDFIRFMKE